jgi:ABC-type branched-subunit amino acid transport system permease subunit
MQRQALGCRVGPPSVAVSGALVAASAAVGTAEKWGLAMTARAVIALIGGRSSVGGISTGAVHHLWGTGGVPCRLTCDTPLQVQVQVCFTLRLRPAVQQLDVALILQSVFDIR